MSNGGQYTFAFASDENYWMPTYVAIYSLLYHHRSDELDIYILYTRSNKTFKRRLNWLGKLNRRAKFHLIDISKELPHIASLKTTHHITKGTYIRFFIDSYVPKTLSRIIYLDSDLIINAPLHRLVSTNIDDFLLAAVREPGTLSDIGYARYPEASFYFNAGVLLINLVKWREERVSRRLLQYCVEHPHRVKWPSQDPLNAIAAGKCWQLPEEFNYHHGLLSADDRVLARKPPVIIHYSGSSKPWQYQSSHPYKALYWQYLRRTPYRYYVPRDVVRGMFAQAARWIR